MLSSPPDFPISCCDGVGGVHRDPWKLAATAAGVCMSPAGLRRALPQSRGGGVVHYADAPSCRQRGGRLDPAGAGAALLHWQVPVYKRKE